MTVRKDFSVRPPDLIIGSADNPYMRRWILFRWKGCQIALHNICRSDDDRALHDHVGWNVSIILWGRYTEHLSHAWEAHRAKRRYPWLPYCRPAGRPHRLELRHGPVWTLWIRGKHIREWGFYCPKGWVHWTKFTRGGKEGQSTIGRGCD